MRNAMPVQWSNQTFTRGNVFGSASASFAGCAVCDGNLFVLEQGTCTNDGSGLIYFDDEGNSFQPYQQSTSNQTFFVRYDTQTGNYINYGVVPATNALTGLSPTVVNNRVFSYANMISSKKIFQWNREEELIQSIDLYASGSVKHPSLLANNQGYLLYSLNTTASVSFPNGISANCPSEQSSAVFTLYHNPEFATPYVGIPEYDGPEPEVRLWPNPATDHITIESPEDLPINAVAVTNLAGQLLFIQPVGNTRTEVNVRTLAPGTYIAHINTRAGSVERKFVVGR